MSECLQCNQIIQPNIEFLQCVQCKKSSHLACLSNITKQDFDYIVSSKSPWKCVLCDMKKVQRGDNTPLTPTTIKEITFYKASGSEAESDSSSTGTTKKICCAKCNKGFAHNAYKIKCVICQRVFHFKCTKDIKTKEDYKENENWKCDLCVQESSAAGYQVKPSGDKVQAESGSLPLSTDKLQTPISLVTTGVSLSDILAEMKSFRNEIKNSNEDFRNEIRATNEDFKKSLESYGEWIIDNGKKIEDVAKMLNDVINDVDLVKQENVNLKKSVSDLTTKVNVLEQALKDNVLEIQGVPYEDKEDLMNLLKKISNSINFNFNEDMIDKCYRINVRPSTGNRPGAIVVRFVRHMDMQRFVQNRREKRNLNSRDIGFMGGDAMPIYINYSLTQAKRKILNAARQAKTDKQYTFLWVREGRIFMRKQQGDRYIVIDSLDDVAKLE